MKTGKGNQSILGSGGQQRNWQPQFPRIVMNLSWTYRILVNYWVEQRKLMKRQHNSRKHWETQLPGNEARRSMPVFSQLRCRVVSRCQLFCNTRQLFICYLSCHGRLTEVANFVFVRLIEQESGMYDKRHADYTRQDNIDLTWERNSHETKESGSRFFRKKYKRLSSNCHWKRMHPVFSFLNIVFKQPVALIYYLFHIYFRVNCNLLCSHSFPNYMVRLYTAIIRCLTILRKLLHCISKFRIACERNFPWLK
jgi:hypothetical protein